MFGRDESEVTFSQLLFANELRLDTEFVEQVNFLVKRLGRLCE